MEGHSAAFLFGPAGGVCVCVWGGGVEPSELAAFVLRTRPHVEIRGCRHADRAGFILAPSVARTCEIEPSISLTAEGVQR